MGRRRLDLSVVAELARQGKTRAEIVEITGASYPTILKYIKANEIIVCRKPNGPVGSVERNARIGNMFKQGATMQTIGECFGISRERVRQILERLGVNASEGGVRKTSNLKRERKTAAIRARCQLKYSIDLDRLKELRSNGLLSAFQRQKANAYTRGIEWSLTLAEWLSVWETSGKLGFRGRGSGFYVMSRFGDEGAYAIGNVHIQPFSDNCREGVQKVHARRRAAVIAQFGLGA